MVLAIPGSAFAGWGTPEPVGTNINQILLPPGGPGLVVGFPATAPARLRLAPRPFAGPLGSPEEFPSGIGQHTLPVFDFDASGDAVILDEEVQKVAWRSANGATSVPQKLEGHLLARWPRLVSVAPSGAALIGVNELRGGGSPVQLAFRSPGIGGSVDTANTVDLTNNGTLVGLQLQADGGAIAVYLDEAGGVSKLMQVVRRSGQPEFDAPTEIIAPPGTLNVSGVTFSSDPSGWAMLAATGKSAEGGAVDQVLGDVRAPDGSFPTATVAATGASVSSPTPAVTASGDGLVTWEEKSLGNPACFAFGIRGVAQHLGAWSAPITVGPGAWPDASVPAAGSTSSGNDISVPMLRIHRDGSPCPTSPQTRSLIVHHYRSGPAGLTDQGISELTPLSGTNQQQIEGWAMEPAGKIFAWYRVGEERFLRAFDGVTPGPGGGLLPPETPVGPSAPGADLAVKPLVAPGAKPPAEILPLKLQQFAIVPTIDPKSLEFEMHCPPVGEESCQGRAFFYGLLTGKQIKPDGVARLSAAKKHLTLIATGSIKIKAGAHGRVKMRPNKVGKALLGTGAKLKVTLKLEVTEGQRSVTGTLPATIKASKPRR